MYRLIRWIFSNKNDLITPDLREAMSAAELAELPRKFIQDFLISAPERPPISFDQFDMKDFQCYLVSLRKDDGSHPSKSVYDSARTSLKHLFEIYNRQLGSEREASLKKFYKGLKRQIASRKAEGTDRIQEGKTPREFGFY